MMSEMAKFRTTIGGSLEVMQDGQWTAIPYEAANELNRLREALDLIANTGMDARQCMVTAQAALKS